ncbi:cytochrome P450 [Streptomyces bottropensis]|uniref:cytochrome P450 n=1 Tax=Streptomyces bottropensis TaxID=42235 RepID=UPI003A8E6A3E
MLISHESTPEQAQEAGGALGRYLAELFAKKMADPGDDVMSEMAGRVKAGEMSSEEAITMSSAILIAGHETSASMISLGTLALLRNPDQMELLRERGDDPRFVANAVEELLRYLTIVHSGIRRIANEDIPVRDKVIKAGDGVVFELAGANYDAEEFPEPEKLDLSRPARQHHAFGYGTHQCLGQSLARVELQVVYGTLYKRVPTLALAVPFEEVPFARPPTTQACAAERFGAVPSGTYAKPSQDSRTRGSFREYRSPDSCHAVSAAGSADPDGRASGRTRHRSWGCVPGRGAADCRDRR